MSIMKPSKPPFSATRATVATVRSRSPGAAVEGLMPTHTKGCAPSVPSKVRAELSGLGVYIHVGTTGTYQWSFLARSLRRDRRLRPRAGMRADQPQAHGRSTTAPTRRSDPGARHLVTSSFGLPGEAPHRSWRHCPGAGPFQRRASRSILALREGQTFGYAAHRVDVVVKWSTRTFGGRRQQSVELSCLGG